MKKQIISNSRSHGSATASRVIAALAMTFACAVATAGTLDRIKETGHIKLGYQADARPFSAKTDSGKPEGFSIALCDQVADQIKAKLGLSQLAVDWVPVTSAGDMGMIRDGSVDLLCTPAVETLDRRRDVSFSIPVYAGGLRAVMRKDAALALRAAIDRTPGARDPNAKPVWRGSPAVGLLDKKTFAVVAGSTTQTWLADKISMFQIDAKTSVVPDYRTGLQQLSDRKADVFFGERSVLLGAMNSDQREQLVISDRVLTNEPLSLTLARNDDDFRLAVDSALTATYAAPGFADVYAKWFGGVDDNARTFYKWTALQK